MGNTVLGLFGVLFAATLAELLLPGEEGRGTKGVLRLLTALAVVLLLIRPALPYLQGTPAFPFEELVGQSEDVEKAYEEIFSRAVRSGSERELKAALKKLLSSEYGIAQDDAYIKVYFDGKGALLRVEIYLSGLAILEDPDKIAADIGGRLGCETEVR
jgi:hypothetical protein